MRYIKLKGSNDLLAVTVFKSTDRWMSVVRELSNQYKEYYTFSINEIEHEVNEEVGKTWIALNDS